MEEEEYEFHNVVLPDKPCFCTQVEFNGKTDTLFFNDGVRRIDFILVYEDEDKKEYDKRHAFARRKVRTTFYNTLTHHLGGVPKCQYCFFTKLEQCISRPPKIESTVCL